MIRIFSRSMAAKSGNQSWGGNEILRRILWAMMVGLFVIVVYAACFTPLQFLAIVSMGVLLAGASFISGGMLGFLFGIPRTNTPEEGVEVVNQEEASRVMVNPYRPNTNLEQISDWLTKILVGVGLTQINVILKRFKDLTLFFAGYMGHNAGIVASIIVYFVAFGFMLGFLWSRLYMAGAILKAEAQAMEERIVKKVQTKVDEQSQNDARALSYVNQLLDSETPPAISQEELDSAIAKASPLVKVTIFNQAHTFRQQHWNNPKTKERVLRTLPIFKSLIACDTEKKFHRNYAQVGYVLKDQPNPDYAGAEEALSKAIAIRDKTGHTSVWLFYEFNRAFCRIKLNEGAGKELFPRKVIMTDVEKAKWADGIRSLIDRDPTFQNWLQSV